MTRKITMLAIVAASVAVSACNTVRGAGQDVVSVANCTEELMKQGKC